MNDILQEIERRHALYIKRGRQLKLFMYVVLVAIVVAPIVAALVLWQWGKL